MKCEIMSLLSRESGLNVAYEPSTKVKNDANFDQSNGKDRDLPLFFFWCYCN
jgi:hypothetical protein